MPPRDEAPGSTVAGTTGVPWEAGKQRPDQRGDLRSDGIAAGELLGDARRNREMYCVERAHTPDRETRPPRPRPVCPDPDRTPAPAAESAKSYQTNENGCFITKLPSPNSWLTSEELSELRHLLQEFRNRLNDGTRAPSATNLLRAPLERGNIAPISFPPRRLSARMRKVMRSAVADLGAKRITEPAVGHWGFPVVMMKKS